MSSSEDEIEESIDKLLGKDAGEKHDKEESGFFDELEQQFAVEEVPGAAVNEKLAAIITFH